MAKLRELYDKFRPFIERDGLLPPEEEKDTTPVQGVLDLGL
jgi:hypothetical protein